MAAEGAPASTFLTVTSGANLSSIYGVYGGCGCGTWPLPVLIGINVYYHTRRDRPTFEFSIGKVKNEHPYLEVRFSP